LYRLGQYFVERYIRRKLKKNPKKIILDLDRTDDRTCGNQQLTFFLAIMISKCIILW